MGMKHVYMLGLLVSLLVLAGCSGTSDDVTKNNEVDFESDPDKVTVYFFWGQGCPHCAKEKPFLENLEKKYSDEVEVKMYELYNHPDNVPLFKKAAEIHGTQARGVPATFIGEKNWVGFNDERANEIESYIKQCIKNDCNDRIVRSDD